MFATPAARACGPQVEIRFEEASPDRFAIAFTRGPKLRLARLTLSLDGSAAGAVFDDYGGLFLQSPSPSGVAITAVDYAAPPAMSVTLAFRDFLEKRSVDFRTDLDDRGSDPDQNHLAPGELEGATARAILTDETGRTIEIDGRFDRDSRSLLGERACV
jgi:hypothetical protein